MDGSFGLIKASGDKIIEIDKNANFRSDKNIVQSLNQLVLIYLKKKKSQIQKDKLWFSFRTIGNG